jgi:hypothetical protein
VDWARVRGNLRRAAPALASFVIVAAYLLWARGDPVFRANSERGFTWTDSFSVWWYPLAYGLLLPPAWCGLKILARERTPRSDWIIAWLSAAIMLSTNRLYAGVKFQYLVFPPLVVLAVRGAIALHETSPFVQRLLSTRGRTALVGAALCLNAPLCLVKDLPAAGADKDIYMSAGEVEAMRWLGRQPDGVVLSSYHDGNRIPWLSGRRVYIGHWFMTLRLDSKKREVNALFAPDVPPTIKTQILVGSGASYLYLGPEAAPAGFDDSELPLRRLYDAGGCRIYAIELR